MFPALAQLRTACLRQMAQLVCAVLLMAAGLQALAPAYSPVEPTHGSAFSATTLDVALAPARAGEAVRAAPQPPLPLPLSSQPHALVLRPTIHPADPAPRPDSTGPPALRPRAVLPEPRAPPFA